MTLLANNHEIIESLGLEILIAQVMDMETTLRPAFLAFPAVMVESNKSFNPPCSGVDVFMVCFVSHLKTLLCLDSDSGCSKPLCTKSAPHKSNRLFSDALTYHQSGLFLCLSRVRVLFSIRLGLLRMSSSSISRIYSLYWLGYVVNTTTAFNHPRLSPASTWSGYHLITDCDTTDGWSASTKSKAPRKRLRLSLGAVAKIVLLSLPQPTKTPIYIKSR